MTEMLQEYVDSRGVTLRVDRGAGVLRGVKLIGLESLNGRRYRPAALAEAVSLYEGSKVNVNHPRNGPLAPRDYQDRLGVIRQVEFRPSEGLFGNLHFNPKHAIAEQLVWDAENNPSNVGFSHNVLARLSREGEQTTVEAITHVQSVDLVADPAATQGLFEEATPPADAAQGAAGPDVVTLESLQAELRAAALREAGLKRQLKINDLLAAHGLAVAGSAQETSRAVGPAFYDALVRAADDRQVETLITERAEALSQAARIKEVSLADSRRPRSSEQMAAIGQHATNPTTGSDFARAIRLRRTPEAS